MNLDQRSPPPREQRLTGEMRRRRIQTRVKVETQLTRVQMGRTAGKWRSQLTQTVCIRVSRRRMDTTSDARREIKNRWTANGEDRILKLDLAGGERLILHDDGAAGGQDHDVELLLPLVGLLVPVAGHLCVVGRYEGHLETTQVRESYLLAEADSAVTKISAFTKQLLAEKGVAWPTLPGGWCPTELCRPTARPGPFCSVRRSWHRFRSPRSTRTECA